MRRLAIALSALLLLGFRDERTEIHVRCRRLDQQQIDELRARAELLLKSRGATQRAIVACDDELAWLHVQGLLPVRIDESAGIVEGALDELESSLLRERRTIDSGSEPSLGAPTKVRAEGPGGLGLGITTEVFDSDVALGPRLDVAFGAGAISGFASESFRGTLGERTTLLLIDTQLGVAWGAPYAPQEPLGVALGAGFEWMTASRGVVGDLRDSSTVLTAGVRYRLRMDAVALWSGLDLRWRIVPQELGSPIDRDAPLLSPMLHVGALLLVAGDED